MKIAGIDLDGHLLMIVQAKAIKVTKNYVCAFGRSLVAYEVVPPTCLGNILCAACSKPFEPPQPACCGSPIVIEFRPDGEQVYHPDCRPHDRWWPSVATPATKPKPKKTGEQLGF